MGVFPKKNTYDIEESGFQTRPTDQKTIDVRLRSKLRQFSGVTEPP